MSTAPSIDSGAAGWTRRQVRRVHVLAYAAAWLVILAFEYPLWESIPKGVTNPFVWAVVLDLDTLIGNLLLMIVAPFAWRMRGFVLVPGSAVARRIGQFTGNMLRQLAAASRGSALPGAASGVSRRIQLHLSGGNVSGRAHVVPEPRIPQAV
jgi:hypothetical protein